MQKYSKCLRTKWIIFQGAAPQPQNLNEIRDDRRLAQADMNEDDADITYTEMRFVSVRQICISN